MYFIFFIIIPLTLAAEVRYDGYQVLRIVPKIEKQLQNIQDYQKQYKNVSFWNNVIKENRKVDVLVPPSDLKNFKDSLMLANLSFNVMIENIQQLIDKFDFKKDDERSNFDWNSYYHVDKIYRWLQSLATKYPRIVTLIHGGTTYEGRNITGVRISYKKGKKGVFIEGGIHACERISPATCTYIINQLLISQDHIVRSVAESRTWYIFPVTNPDGYEYTQTDSLWRKNRNPIAPECIGVDLNRNWGYKWMHGGGSTDPCDFRYAGNKSFSEIETRSLSQFIETIVDTLEGYISYHSYGQEVRIPFGHNEYEVPENNDELLRIGNIAITALAKRYGTKYILLNIRDFYLASGSSTDWVLGFYRHLKFVYHFSLRDLGQSSYVLPPDQIIPTGEEALDALVSIIQEMGIDKVDSDEYC